MLLTCVYLLAVVAANLSVTHFGPSSAPVNAFIFIGLDLTLRDHLHLQWQGRGLWWKMSALIIVGSGLSAIINNEATPIAIASSMAFLGAGTTDSIVYGVLRRRSRVYCVNVSNLFSAVVDSAIFIWLAFGWSTGIFLLQVLSKVFGGFVWYLVLQKLGLLVPRQKTLPDPVQVSP